MNVYYLMLRGGRWSVIILSMTQAEQTSNLSPYCNESMFWNSNYLFDRLTNDKNSSIFLTPTLAYAQTQTYAHAHAAHDGVRGRVIFNPSCHVAIDGLPRSRPHDGWSRQPKLVHAPVRPATAIISIPDYVMTPLKFHFHLKWTCISGIFTEAHIFHSAHLLEVFTLILIDILTPAEVIMKIILRLI